MEGRHIQPQPRRWTRRTRRTRETHDVRAVLLCQPFEQACGHPARALSILHHKWLLTALARERRKPGNLGHAALGLYHIRALKEPVFYAITCAIMAGNYRAWSPHWAMRRAANGSRDGA